MRRERAGFKRALTAAGRDEALWMVGRLIEAPDWWAGSWDVYDLLLQAPGFGRVKVSKTLAQHRISQNRHLDQLSARQRRELQEALVGRLR